MRLVVVGLLGVLRLAQGGGAAKAMAFCVAVASVCV